MGLTLGCARCHDHKYDPITQKEFYQLYAFFNTVDEKGLDGYRGNARPTLELPTPEQDAKRTQLTEAIADLEKKLADMAPSIKARRNAWVEVAKNHHERIKAGGSGARRVRRPAH